MDDEIEDVAGVEEDIGIVDEKLGDMIATIGDDMNGKDIAFASEELLVEEEGLGVVSGFEYELTVEDEILEDVIIVDVEVAPFVDEDLVGALGLDGELGTEDADLDVDIVVLDDVSTAPTDEELVVVPDLS